VLNTIKETVFDPANWWALWTCSSKILRKIYGACLSFKYKLAIKCFAVLGGNR